MADSLLPRPFRKVLTLATSAPALMLIDQGFVSLGSFLAMVLVGRVCGEAALGSYGVAFTVLWLAAAIPNCLIWIPYTNQPKSSKDSESAEQFLLPASMILLFCGVMLLPVGLVTLSLVDRSWQLAVGMFLFQGGMTLREHLRRVAIADLKLATLLMIDLPVVIVQLVLLVGLAAMGWLNTVSALSILGLVAALPFLAAWTRKRGWKTSWRKLISSSVGNWRQGKWLVGASVISAGSEALVRFMIVQIVGQAPFGRFIAAFSLPMFANPIVITCGNYLRVLLARKWNGGGLQAIRGELYRSIALFGLLGLLIYGSVAILGELSASFTFGSKYRGLGELIALICFGLWISMMAIPSEMILTVSGRASNLIYATSTRLVIMLVMGFPMIYFGGLIGGALTVAIGFAAQLVLQTWLASAALARESAA